METNYWPGMQILHVVLNIDFFKKESTLYCGRSRALSQLSDDDMQEAHLCFS